MTADPLGVLVVEDNRGDVRLIEEGIEESPVACSPTFLTDGEGALEELDRRIAATEGLPDLLLLDLNVPKRDGREILAAIRAEAGFDPLAVVILSGSGADNYVQETYDLGADGYFVKPADPHAFIDLIDELVTGVADGRVPAGRFAEFDSAS